MPTIKNIPTRQIYVPNPRFPDCQKGDPLYQYMLDSVRKDGILCALQVMPMHTNVYWLLDGRLRLAVADELKIKRVRCSIYENS